MRIWDFCREILFCVLEINPVVPEFIATSRLAWSRRWIHSVSRLFSVNKSNFSTRDLNYFDNFFGGNIYLDSKPNLHFDFNRDLENFFWNWSFFILCFKQSSLPQYFIGNNSHFREEINMNYFENFFDTINCGRKIINPCLFQSEFWQLF